MSDLIFIKTNIKLFHMLWKVNLNIQFWKENASVKNILSYTLFYFLKYYTYTWKIH